MRRCAAGAPAVRPAVSGSSGDWRRCLRRRVPRRSLSSRSMPPANVRLACQLRPSSPLTVAIISKPRSIGPIETEFAEIKEAVAAHVRATLAEQLVGHGVVIGSRNHALVHGQGPVCAAGSRPATCRFCLDGCPARLRARPSDGGRGVLVLRRAVTLLSCPGARQGPLPSGARATVITCSLGGTRAWRTSRYRMRLSTSLSGWRPACLVDRGWVSHRVGCRPGAG